MRNLAVLCLVLLPGIFAAEAGEDPAALVRALGSPRPATRAEAAARLRKAGREALPAIREGLRSGDLLVVLACADLVREGALREARPELREILGGDRSPLLLVRACCRALGRVGDYRDVELLAGLLPRAEEAALALADIGEPEGREPLRAALSGGDARPEIAYALAALGDLSGVPHLIEAVGAGEDRAFAAALYLRRISGRDLGAERGAWEVWWRRERLARALGDPDWDASERALQEVLAGERGPRAERLGDLLALARDPVLPRDARTKAILALGLLGDRGATAPLLSLLTEDDEPNVRLYAAEALGRIGDPAVAVDLAYYLVFDEEPFRRRSEKGGTGPYVTIDSEVAKSLVRLGVAGGLDFLVRQLSGSYRIRVYHEAVRELRRATGKSMGFRPDARREDRAAAARRWRLWFDENREQLALPAPADFTDPRFVAGVRERVDLLGHYKFLTMSRALETLVLLGEAAYGELVAGLSRPELHVRAHCARILGRIHARRARPALARLLGDPRPEARAAAAAALADMGPGDGEDAVAAALGDEAASVRIEAARALARADPARAGPALRAALSRAENDLPAFRREAWFALGAHGDAGAVEELARLLDLEGEGVPFLRAVGDRIERLTGRDPGVSRESIAAWREWWGVKRLRYAPEYPYGTAR